MDVLGSLKTFEHNSNAKVLRPRTEEDAIAAVQHEVGDVGRLCTRRPRRLNHGVHLHTVPVCVVVLLSPDASRTLP